ncbi:MAG: pyruvate kinase [Vicinamibacterales bacterium]
MRHTKIVATIGPATASEAGIGELLQAGVDVFRLNFSHGDHASHGAVLNDIRRAAARAGRTVAILQDLSGPKIRTGLLEGRVPIPLAAGDTLVIAAGEFVGGPGRVSTTYAELPRAVRPGDALLLDDGRIQLEVVAAEDTQLTARVIDGGLLGEHKGINAPGIVLPSAGLTGKDEADLRFGVGAGVDMIALSFVQGPEVLQHARTVARDAGAPDIPLVAKLERPEAIYRLDEILPASDAVMVARGDLGLELPLERVPRVQKEITRRARALGIPVIVATQVLESMREEPRPTRAEVSDAANAVNDGVDAIMLAGETAVGRHPARTVRTLDAIIREAESMPPEPVALEDGHMAAAHGRAICEAAVTLAERGEASVIVAVTHAGHTAQMLAAFRPRAPIYAATPLEPIARRLALTWGVIPVVADVAGDVSEVAYRIGTSLVEKGSLAAGSTMVVVSVSPDLARGAANFLKLQRV